MIDGMRRIVSLLVPTLGLLLASLSTSCAGPGVPVEHPWIGKTLYTQVGLRGTPKPNQVVDIYPSPFISHERHFAPGNEAVIKSFDDKKILVTIGGHDCELKFVEGRLPTDQAAADAFLGKLFAETEPDLSGLHDGRRFAIMHGQAPLGSTKAEVLLALGYPLDIGEGEAAKRTFDLSTDAVLAADRWGYRDQYRYFWSTPMVYVFENGILVRDLSLPDILEEKIKRRADRDG